MLSQSDSNDNKDSTHSVLEESKVKRDEPRDGLLKSLIADGISALIHLFDLTLDRKGISYISNLTCLVFRGGK